MSRCNYGICLLALALALVGPGWAQIPQAAESDATLYTRAVALLDQAEQQLTAKNLPSALAAVKQSNELFTFLQKKSAAALAERQLSRQDEQQLAINEKLATEAQAQADRLLETAAAKKKQAMETQGMTEAAETALRESREGYLQSQTLSIKAAIYALRNQQIIFRFLAP
ncbi:MAG: hypothetical protein A2139_01665 [Desulfobacca sp. RBG_16_60_12]|nr:MAG: hypothetical protein A2139_01665 [Desulfobacca sp. RBG_16_60_12]